MLVTSAKRKALGEGVKHSFNESNASRACELEYAGAILREAEKSSAKIRGEPREPLSRCLCYSTQESTQSDRNKSQKINPMRQQLFVAELVQHR